MTGERVRLFVQIPCLNEEVTLPLVLATIPTHIDGIDEIHVLVVDDGSTDETIEVAKAHGVTHVVRHSSTMGLARSFADGVNYALLHGADILVNTDGDNQYPQDRIGDLVAPILSGNADIVIADRQTQSIQHFSPFKKLMQRVGSGVVNFAAGTHLPDAASGFRAYSRDSLMKLNVVTQFSYCMETIIQAGNKRLRIESLPVTTNVKTRESRLFKNDFEHMSKSARAIARSYLMYRPHVVFSTLALVFLTGAAIPVVRFLLRYFTGHGDGNIQSLVLAVGLLVASLLCFVLMIISEMLRTNRTLLEDCLERTKQIQFENVQTGRQGLN